ncbi:3D domain-containing protein [Trichothermofontia sp.]
MVPYRTIAVDRQVIPIGAVVFIPAARGQAITLPSGYQAVHDGFFFAADTGGAVRGNHIDVFVGNAEQNPFPFIKSTPSATFRAYIIQDERIAQILTALHRRTTINEQRVTSN